jgi:protein-S-isoprenylcysteine O-methyltransferase Ste14
MEFSPEMELGLYNGWLPILLFYIIFGIILVVFPRDVVTRLYERSGWTTAMKVTRVFGVVLIFSWIGIITYSPLKIGNLVFYIGAFIYILGLVCFLIALLNYRDTPLDQPVTKGLYRISRNPQHVTLFLSFLGISIAVGSWLATILLLIAIILGHMRILTEERACLEQYGDSYQRYMEQVPRYFVFF